MPHSHSLILAAICRVLHIRYPRPPEAPKQIDVHALDDWSEEFLGAKGAHTAEIGDIYIELWREWAKGHKNGKSEIASAYRDKGRELTADLKEITSSLRNKYRPRQAVAADSGESAEDTSSRIAAVQASE